MKNYKNAIIIMIVAMVLSSLISGVVDINSQVSELEDHFYKGSSDSQYLNTQSIYADIEDKTEIANNLVSMAKYYLDSDEEHITAISDAISDFTSSSNTISDYYEINSTLDTNVDWLIAELYNLDLTDTHNSLLVGYESSYKSEKTTINSDNYNTLVDDFNEETSGVIATIIKLFANDAEYFR